MWYIFFNLYALPQDLFTVNAAEEQRGIIRLPLMFVREFYVFSPIYSPIIKFVVIFCNASHCNGAAE